MRKSASGFPAETIHAIEKEFRSKAVEMFANRLGFAFIFGGFGKGYGGWGHDVDMFIVVTVIDSLQVSTFRSWYMDLHYRCGLPPDEEHPGEVIVLDDLERRIALLEERRIRRVIETLYEYEAILWADALSERKVGMVQGPAVGPAKLADILERASRLNARWREEMLEIRSETPEKLSELDLRRLFKGHVTYLKGPGI